MSGEGVADWIMDTVPPDLQREIASFLDARDLARITTVSSPWNLTTGELASVAKTQATRPRPDFASLFRCNRIRPAEPGDHCRRYTTRGSRTWAHVGDFTFGEDQQWHRVG